MIKEKSLNYTIQDRKRQRHVELNWWILGFLFIFTVGIGAAIYVMVKSFNAGAANNPKFSWLIFWTLFIFTCLIFSILYAYSMAK